MKKLHLINSSIEKIIEVKNNEIGYIIIPNIININYLIKENIDMSNKIFSELNIRLMPIKKGDSFYAIEDMIFCKQCGHIWPESKFFYNKNPECPGCKEDFITEKGLIKANDIEYKDSRFKGECIDINSIQVKYLEKGLIDFYKKNINEYEKLYDTNIKPTSNDYVYLLKIKRLDS